MSNNRIFGGSRYEAQGRNVNLTGTMFKRSPIFTHTPVEKIQTSPFANYSCKTGQSFLSESQASIPEINPDAIRQLIKEQLMKVQSPEETNRKIMHTLQAQITDLKERIGEYEKDNNKKLQQAVLNLRGDFRTQAQKMGKDVQLQITNKLRSFFQKANLELKKDILKIIEEEFLTTGEGEDFNNRLECLDQKIESIASLISNNKITPIQEKQQQSPILSQQIQAKIAKLQRDLQQNKKHSSESLTKLKNLQEWRQDQTSKRSQKIIQQKIDHMRQKLKSIDQQIQKRFGTFQIKLSGTEGDISSLKEKLVQLQKNNEEQSILFLDLSKRISSRGRQSQQGDLAVSLTIPQKSLDISVDLNIMRNEQAREEAAIKKQVYQLDSQGFLMDGDRKYLLTDDNQMIKLSQEQIEVLLSSQAIQIIEK